MTRKRSNREQLKAYHWGRDLDLSGPRHRYREWLIVKYLGKIEPGRFLDAGFGTGSLALTLVSHGVTVSGVDLSIHFVEAARRKVYLPETQGRVVIMPGDIRKLDFPNDWFQGVVCGEVLEHVVNDQAAVREFYRVLAPGGICVVTVPSGSKGWDITDEWAGHVRLYDRGNLASIFEQAGFHVERVDYWGFPFATLYYRCLYLPMMKRRLSTWQGCTSNITASTPLLRLATIVLPLLFRVDYLFKTLPLGIGLILRARKRGRFD